MPKFITYAPCNDARLSNYINDVNGTYGNIVNLDYAPHITLLSADGARATKAFSAIDADTMSYSVLRPAFTDLARNNLEYSVALKPPLRMTITGTGVFSPSKSSDNKYVAVLLPNVPGLTAFRAHYANFFHLPDGDFGWTPHITVAYLPSYEHCANALRDALYHFRGAEFLLDRIAISGRRYGD